MAWKVTLVDPDSNRPVARKFFNSKEEAIEFKDTQFDETGYDIEVVETSSKVGTVLVVIALLLLAFFVIFELWPHYNH